MSEDYRVGKRSDRQVRDTALRTKTDYGTERRRPVNIIRCLQSGTVLTDQGRKSLVYKVLDDEEMGTTDGKTEFIDGTVVISVKRSVHEKAFWGDGRSRMTLAHELAHAVMHYGAPKFRRSDAAGATVLSAIDASESAEHQAKVFASAFLIDDAVAKTLRSPNEISLEFGVSLQAAEICFERLAREAERALAAERIGKSNEALQSSMSKPLFELKYTGDFCPRCGNATLIPMGIKFLCHTCDNIIDIP